jgi:FMN phosphatase YigB (HAD superfamily)
VDFGPVDVVSFDLFQTLLDRPGDEQARQLALLDPLALELSQGALNDFAAARLAAKGWVSERNGEEVTLRERYRALERRFGIKEDAALALMRAEMELDERLLRASPRAQNLFQQALAQGKAVCITSDTFYPRDFVERLLQENGFEGYQHLYLSSEVGLLKNSGRLFQHVLSDLGVAPDRVLHIGDDPTSDVRRAAECGIRTCRFVPSSEVFTAHARGARFMRYSDDRAHSWIRGFVARRFAASWQPDLAPSFVGAGAEHLGYSVFGPMLLGFVLWLVREFERDGVDRAFFLSRDGRVMKQAYDRLRLLRPELPPSVYLHASRRGTCLPALRRADELETLLDLPAAPMALDALLHCRFGLCASDLATVSPGDYGFDAWTASIRIDRDRAKLRTLLQALSPRVLAIASDEREQLSAYYRDAGLLDSVRPALVDIGHQGTLQTAIARVTARADLAGYYFASVEAIAALGASARSFVGFASERPGTLAAYEPRLQLFELLFLSDESSFVRVSREAHGWRVHTLDAPRDGARQALARALHRGALDFIDEVASGVGGALFDFRVAPEEALAPYLEMLANPCRADAEPFVGVELENAYSGRARRGVVEAFSIGAVWPEGQRALRGSRDPRVPVWARWVERAAQRRSALRKLRKLLRDPGAFLRDSRFVALRRLGGGH